MSDHIEPRRNLWYAVLVIPKKARPVLGKYKFIQSLHTADKREAKHRALALISKWRAEIKQALGQSGAVQSEAIRWRESLAAVTDPHEREGLELVLSSKAEEMESKAGYTAAKTFYDIASGQATPSSMHLDEWRAQLTLKEKTKEQMVKDVDRFVVAFPTLEDVSSLATKRWLDAMNAGGLSGSAVKRAAKSARNYWRFLQRVGAVPPDKDPLRDAMATTIARPPEEEPWAPFEVADVVKLHHAARERGDTHLADLIRLAAYSGARIEELCSLKVTDATDTEFHITKAKTKAGIRQVPIHSALRKTVERLKRDSVDGYLFTRLTFNKYGHRSNAIGKRFGRLKKDAGFSKDHVFHSIRKTFATAMENAGIAENLVADILGHKKERITFGGYSGGNVYERKKAAVEKVRYPFSKG